jgi:hypothetical protein
VPHAKEHDLKHIDLAPSKPGPKIRCRSVAWRSPGNGVAREEAVEIEEKRRLAVALQDAGYSPCTRERREISAGGGPGLPDPPILVHQHRHLRLSERRQDRESGGRG